jgi:hypothetical protein
MTRRESRRLLCKLNDVIAIELMEGTSCSPLACELGVLALGGINAIVKPFPNFLWHMMVMALIKS